MDSPEKCLPPRKRGLHWGHDRQTNARAVNCMEQALTRNELMSLSIFGLTLLALFTDRWHRVVVTGLGASLMLAAGHLLGFYSEAIAIDAVEFETLGLLLGMMILVALLQRTGFFEYVGIRVARVSGGSYGALLLMLGISTSLLSMVLDNVTTIMLMAPMLLLIAELLDISPIPLLISQAMFSNLGGMATLVGDPPNILIGAASGLTFTDFLMHMGPFVLVAWSVSYLSFRLMFRNHLTPVTPEQQARLGQLKLKEALHNPTDAKHILIVIAGVVALFFLEGTLHIAPAFAAMTGAGLALAWTQDEVHEVLQAVEWDVLLFFTALFIMVGGLEQAGVLHRLADALLELQTLSPVMMGLVILWTMTVLSALVDNVPITIATIPVLLLLGDAGVNIQPLWWALALGAGLGGNATPIGSTANVIVMSVCERGEHDISTRRWLRIGVPITLLSTAAVSIAYLALYDFMAF